MSNKAIEATKKSKTTINIVELPDGYSSILKGITEKIRAAQTRAMKAINFELIEIYHDI